MNKVKTGVAAALVGLGLGALGGRATTPTPHPTHTQVTRPIGTIGSGQARAQVAAERGTPHTPHEIELAGHFIRQSEKFVPKAYDLGDGKITIGFGTTQYANGKPVKMGDTITREQAEIGRAHV